MKTNLSLVLLYAVLPVAAIAADQDHSLIYNVNAIDKYGDQSVRFLDKKGECYYYGQVKATDETKPLTFLGIKYGEQKITGYSISVNRKVCRDISYPVSYIVLPSLRVVTLDNNISSKQSVTLMPAGTEFRLFENQKEAADYIINNR